MPCQCFSPAVHAAAAEESKYTTGRIMQCFMYARAGSAHDNHYAHPLDLLVVLDMNTRAVLDIQAHPLPPAIPALSTNYLAPLVHKERGTRSGAFPASWHACLPCGGFQLLVQSSMIAWRSHAVVIENGSSVCVVHLHVKIMG